MVERFEHSVEAGSSAAAEVLALDPGVTALVATSDVLALGAMAELARRRRRVPEDVSVTGFDGVRAALDAKLTTVVQPVVDKGRAAGRLLLNPGPPPAGQAGHAGDHVSPRRDHVSSLTARGSPSPANRNFRRATTSRVRRLGMRWPRLGRIELLRHRPGGAGRSL